MPTFAERLREARKIKSWTQGQLADRMGWHQSKVSRLETEVGPASLDDVNALACVIECSRGWLLGLSLEGAPSASLADEAA